MLQISNCQASAQVVTDAVCKLGDVLALSPHSLKAIKPGQLLSALSVVNFKALSARIRYILEKSMMYIPLFAEQPASVDQRMTLVADMHTLNQLTRAHSRKRCSRCCGG